MSIDIGDWFKWNGVKSTEFGLHAMQQPSVIRSKERTTYITVPGRSGALTMLEGDDVYDDITLSVSCMIENESQVHKISQWLQGNGRIEFPVQPDGFYLGRLDNQISFDRIVRGNPHRAFSVQFRVRPYFYYTSGEKAIAITKVKKIATLTNPGNVPAKPLIQVTPTSRTNSAGIISIGGKTLTINSFQNAPYILLDCEEKLAYKGIKGSSSDPLTLLTSRVSGEWPVLPIDKVVASYFNDALPDSIFYNSFHGRNLELAFEIYAVAQPISGPISSLPTFIGEASVSQEAYSAMISSDDSEDSPSSSSVVSQSVISMVEDSTLILPHSYVEDGVLHAPYTFAQDGVLYTPYSEGFTEAAEEASIDVGTHGDVPAGSTLSTQEHHSGFSVTINGVKWTALSDGSLIADGTATSGNSVFELTGRTLDDETPVLTLDPSSEYVLYGCPSGGSTSTYALTARVTPEEIPPGSYSGRLVRDMGNSCVISGKYAWIYAVVFEGATVNNVRFFPTFHKTGLLLKETGSAERAEHNGVTWTKDLDGNVTANGTAAPLTGPAEPEEGEGSESGDTASITTGTGNSRYFFTGKTLTPVSPVITLDSNKRYTLFGCPSGGSDGTYALVARVTPEGETPGINSGSLVLDTGKGCSFSGKYCCIYAAVAKGTTATNLKFSPTLATSDEVIFLDGNISRIHIIPRWRSVG